MHDQTPLSESPVTADYHYLDGGCLVDFFSLRVRKIAVLAWGWTHNLRYCLSVRCPWLLSQGDPKLTKLRLTLYLIYIYKSYCLYLCPLFTPEPPDQSPPNFAQTSTPTQGRFLTQAWPRQPDPWTPGYPNSKTKKSHGRENLYGVKCPDGWLNLIKFFLGSAGPRQACLSI